MFKKIILIALISLFINSVNGAYTEIDCSTDKIFNDNSCNQCFDGGVVKVGDNISFLDDIWTNDTANQKIMNKEEQTFPEMEALNGASFIKNPENDSFWEYTSELEALKNSEFDGYVLPAGQKVSWIKSSLGSAYGVKSIPTKGQNAGILVFDLMAHDIINGEIAMSDETYKECILYKAGETPKAPVVKKLEPKPEPKEMTKVQAGPESVFMLFILSFLIGIAILNRKMILEKVKK